MFASYMFLQHIVNQRLVVTAACLIYLLPKPLQNVVVQANRDSGLPF